MKRKKCHKCKKINRLSQFHKNKKAKDGLQSYCKGCMREINRLHNKTEKRRKSNKKHYERLKKDGYFKEYQQRPEVKKRKAEQMRMYSRDPILRMRHEARWQIRHRVAAGTIQKPKKCSRCSNTEKIQAHHPDYNKPLEIIWLCYDCHRIEDAKAKQ